MKVTQHIMQHGCCSNLRASFSFSVPSSTCFQPVVKWSPSSTFSCKAVGLQEMIKKHTSCSKHCQCSATSRILFFFPFFRTWSSATRKLKYTVSVTVKQFRNCACLKTNWSCFNFRFDTQFFWRKIPIILLSFSQIFAVAGQIRYVKTQMHRPFKQRTSCSI